MQRVSRLILCCCVGAALLVGAASNSFGALAVGQNVTVGYGAGGGFYPASAPDGLFSGQLTITNGIDTSFATFCLEMLEGIFPAFPDFADGSYRVEAFTESADVDGDVAVSVKSKFLFAAYGELSSQTGFGFLAGQDANDVANSTQQAIWHFQGNNGIGEGDVDSLAAQIIDAVNDLYAAIRACSITRASAPCSS
jgi:hypothetical protein